MGKFEGLETQYANQLNRIRNKTDALVVFMHWSFLKSGLKCLGVGEQMSIEPNETGSELLPNTWNENPKYPLRYIYNGQAFLFSVQTSSNVPMFLVLRMNGKDLKMASVAINPETDVAKIEGKIEEIFPSMDDLYHTIKKNLLEDVTEKKTVDTSVQTEETKGKTNLIVTGPSREPHRPRHETVPRVPFGIPGYGMGDLNPLGVGGGGMIFDPMIPRHGGFNPRYDPIGPPDIDRSLYRPRPDHLRPPEFDDMFS